MPAGKIYRVYKGKRTKTKGAKSTRAIAKRALKMVTRYKPELKYHQEGPTSGTIDYNGTVFTVNDPAQGATDLTRNGDQIICSQLKIFAQLYSQGTVANAGRIMVIWDKQNTISTAGDIINDVGGAQAPYGHQDFDLRNEYIVLWDTGPVSVAPSDRQYKNFKKTINLKGRRTTFEGGTTTINTGAIKVLIIGNNTAANLLGYVYNIRFTFYDP